MFLDVKPNGKKLLSTEDLHTIINEVRGTLGESSVKYADMLARVLDELDGDENFNGEIFVVKVLSNNTERKVYTLTLEHALLVGMRESKAVRRAVLHRLKKLENAYADPPRSGLIMDKRKSMWDMTDALKEIRAENGKDTEAHHYATENKLINWCIKGKFAALNEKTLSNEEMEICKKLRLKNAAFIRADMEYAERKVKLKEYTARLQNIKLLPA